MLHEARDRQKFVSDVQYLRDMQHKVDSEYQACLKRQEHKKEPNEKKQEQLWGKDTSDRSRFSSGSSCKQSSGEEDSLSEARLATKAPTAKCEPKLPAIDQTSVKQKHKGTMTLKKPEKVSPSKPSAVAQATKILSRKRRPNLGRLTVSPEMHSPRLSGERSRQKAQLSTKTSGLLGADPVVQQDSLLSANEMKLKRPAREKRNLAPFSPIRNRNPSAASESHSEDTQGEEERASTSQAQESPLLSDLPNPQSSMALGDSPSSPTRRHLQGHFYMPGSLQENIPFTFFAVSDFASQNDNGTSVRVSGVMDEKATEIKADPEKLRKLQESLLEEDSEEEGDLCRICQIAGGSPANPLLEPCGCVGSLQFVHQECLKKWLKVKITSGADLSTVKTCEMCKQGLLVDLDDFNMTEFYHKHQQSRAQSELMNSGLYLVLLLHLYEQRFAELMTLNYRRASRERMSRNYPQPRPEESESSESGDGNESNVYPGRVI